MRATTGGARDHSQHLCHLGGPVLHVLRHHASWPSPRRGRCRHCPTEMTSTIRPRRSQKGQLASVPCRRPAAASSPGHATRIHSRPESGRRASASTVGV